MGIVVAAIVATALIGLFGWLEMGQTLVLRLAADAWAACF